MQPHRETQRGQMPGEHVQPRGTTVPQQHRGHSDRITLGWQCPRSPSCCHLTAGDGSQPSHWQRRATPAGQHRALSQGQVFISLIAPGSPPTKSTDGAEARAGSDGFVPGMNLQLSAVTTPELPTCQAAGRLRHTVPIQSKSLRGSPMLGMPHRVGLSRASLPLCLKHRVGFTTSKGPRVPSCSHAALHTSSFPWRGAG